MSKAEPSEKFEYNVTDDTSHEEIFVTLDTFQFEIFPLKFSQDGLQSDEAFDEQKRSLISVMLDTSHNSTGIAPLSPAQTLSL